MSSSGEEHYVAEEDEDSSFYYDKIDDSNEAVKLSSNLNSQKKTFSTGRSVTTKMLIQDGILEPGEKLLSIIYLGHKFYGDLQENGEIFCHTSGQPFRSPSSWAVFCKQRIQPNKKSGCGWASVRYKGQKLDTFKSKYFHKKRIEQAENKSQDDEELANIKLEEEESFSGDMINLGDIKQERDDDSKSAVYVPPTQNYLTFSEALLAVQNKQTYASSGSVNSYEERNPSCGMSDPTFEPPSWRHNRRASADHFQQSTPVSDAMEERRRRTKRAIRCPRPTIKHNQVTADTDPRNCVECAHFQSTGRIQPFSVSISNTALLVGDFHAHLLTRPVRGYLAGQWDLTRQHLRVSRAFPFTEDSEECEREIERQIEQSGMVLVGWYHSHPFVQAEPTLLDIKKQVEFQRALQDGQYQPCLALIISQFDSYKPESQVKAFWVREPAASESNSCGSIGLPLVMNFTTQQEQNLTQELVNHLVSLMNSYLNDVDLVVFTDMWYQTTSYLEKLKSSLMRKLPQDQTDGRFLEFVNNMLVAATV